MLSMSARCFQGKNFVATRETVEYELTEARGDSGGADAPHQRPPPQLRHGPERGEFRARPGLQPAACGMIRDAGAGRVAVGGKVASLARDAARYPNTR